MTLTPNRREEMLRVDHAGEYGAVAIYRGQLAVFERQSGRERITGQLKEMAGQEQEHLDAFDKLLNAGSVRPTALSPVWNAAGFALGAATALLGEKAAHACTEAVETVIEEHYGDQIVELEAAGETELAATMTKFRDEEVAHKELATSEGAAQAPAYPVLSALIRFGCRAAIRISEKV
ncbi:MAG TPA: demethoxyubiquinone hydroxylase family protein [Hyphomonadaceae bacterium]|nr:demethoxyubiquinone hydroxylase family protein [Hyphomonadaceae bacterium]HPI50415.1 demethoxyubiquinone hydroxylase family protein [Hyphomonadaceae bacterium]